MTLAKRSAWGLAALVFASACSDDKDDDGMLGGGIDAGTDAGIDGSTPGPDAGPGIDGGLALSFFVSSQTNTTANLGGLAGADARCQALATAVGAGGKTWRAFLSVEHDSSKGGAATGAFERIGRGPWYNAKGALLANNVQELLTKTGNADLFLDERGNKINGQWIGSPTPNQHDILTGTLLDGGIALGQTCADWTSESDAGVAIVGHSDGLGPNQDATPPRNSWFAAHENGGCNDTAPRGGAGRIYCFAAN